MFEFESISLPSTTKEPKTRDIHVPETIMTGDKNYHHKIRISGIEETQIFHRWTTA